MFTPHLVGKYSVMLLIATWTLSMLLEPCFGQKECGNRVSGVGWAKCKTENTKVLSRRCTFFKLYPVGKSCEIPDMLSLPHHHERNYKQQFSMARSLSYFPKNGFIVKKHWCCLTVQVHEKSIASVCYDVLNSPKLCRSLYFQMFTVLFKKLLIVLILRRLVFRNWHFVNWKKVFIIIVLQKECQGGKLYSPLRFGS